MEKVASITHGLFSRRHFVYLPTDNSHYYISIVKVAFFLCFIGREHITRE